jgi:hypothetical protein
LEFLADSAVQPVLEAAVVVLGMFAAYLVLIMGTNRAIRRLADRPHRKRSPRSALATGPAGAPNPGGASGPRSRAQGRERT